MAGELEFSEKLRVQKEEPTKKRWPEFIRLCPYRALLLVLLWLELVFTAGCLITVLKLPVQTRPVICAGVVCGLVWFFFYSIRGKWRYLLLLVGAAGAVLLFRRNFELVQQGFFYVANAFSRLFYNYYNVSLFHFEVSGEEELCCAAFFAFLLLPVAACYAQTLFRARGRLVSTVLLAVSSLGGLAIGLVPEAVFFIGAFFSALLQLSFTAAQSEYCVRGEKIRREYAESQKRGAKTALFFCVVLAVIGAVASRWIDEESYRSRMDMREKKQQLQEEMGRIAALPVWHKIASAFSDSTLLPAAGKQDSTARIGGLNSGRFSRAGQIGFDNVIALYVTLPELNRAVYLRGYTGAVYTQSGWEELDRNAAKEYEVFRSRYEIASQEQGYRMMNAIYRNAGPILQKYYNLGNGPIVTKGEMRVEYETASRRYVYAPYYINPLERGNYTYVQDGYLTSAAREEVHDFTFLMPSLEWLYRFGELTERNQEPDRTAPVYLWQGGIENSLYRQFSAAYHDFVNEYYTVVPQGHEALKDLLPGAADGTVNDRIYAVQQFLSQYEYTLSPGEMPADADFVNYFLFENKKGYCVHFASAAVLMLRSLGVPARYAEGYLITQGDIEQAEAVAAQTISERMEMRYNLGGIENGLKPPSANLVLQKRVEVRDYTAHAWVEVYLEEIGWVPVEMTSGYMDNAAAGQRPDEIMQEVEGLNEPTAIPTKAATPTPRPTNTPTPTPVDIKETLPGEELLPTDTPPQGTATPTPQEKPGAVPAGEGPEKGEKTEPKKSLKERFAELPGGVRFLIKGCVLLMCAICILYARYRIVWRVRTRQGIARKKQVLWYYAQMERILCRMGLKSIPQEGYEEFAERVAKSGLLTAKNFARCQRMALAAGFGRAHITKEEAGFLLENYGKMRDELFAKCRPVRKCYLKFIKLY